MTTKPATPKPPAKAKAKAVPPGPKPEVAKTEGDWGNALKKALEKKRPAEGWPKPRKAPKGG